MRKRFYDVKNMKGKNKYPAFEEEVGNGVMTAAEPAVAYANTQATPGMAYIGGKAEITDNTPVGMFGFYTDNPQVLEQRIAEMEDDMDEVDAGIENPEKWIEVNDFWTAMRKEHSWL